MMQVVEEVQTLRLDVLDQEWVQSIYYSEFLEFVEFPVEYEEILGNLEINKVFQDIIISIDNWLNSEYSNEERSWAALSKHIPHQKLLAILAYYIDHGSKNVVNEDDRNDAILASRVYYKFMSISGYKAYQIYHSQLFAQSLICLGYPKMMCEKESSYINSRELTKEVNSAIKELRHFVMDLRAIADSLQLNTNDMNFEDILSNLVDVTGGAIVNKLNVDKIELTHISQVIYEIINILMCNANREPNPDAIKMLFKCILPKLISASEDSRNANNLVRASYVTYSGCLLSKYGKATLSGYMILLEHLCYTPDGLERAEVRQARVSLVVGLMSFLPQKSYRRFIEWILLLSDTAKTQHRQIALEILAKLLSNDPEVENPPPSATNQQSTEATESSNNNAGEQAGSENPPPIEGENAEAPPPELAPPDTLQLATDDDSSQDSQEISEDEVAGLLQQRAHTAPHARILRAVYERVGDVSSVLRARALHILTDCLETHGGPLKLALQEFQGSGAVSRLLAVGARSVIDERAAVRRAAVALVLRSLAAAPASAPPAPTDLQILVGMCHDASIIVRSAALTALGELVTTRTSPVVMDAFLNGILHQLADTETKVQDIVTGLIQQVLIDRITKYDPEGDEDPLPWLFLDGVLRLDLPLYLNKACSLLAKNTNCISHRLVDCVSSHLGARDAARDVLALLLLNAVAAHLDYNNIQFALDYYYKLADGPEQECDSRRMALVLELLSTWSRWARLAERTALRDHLVQRLTTAQDDGCRIACSALAAQLDPHSLTWATELLQLAERRAVSSSSVWEWVRAADLALVAPVPPTPALLRLFLGAVNDPPADWSEECVGAAVAGLGRLCVRARPAAELAAPALAALLRRPAPAPAKLNAVLALTDICIRYTCIVEPLLGAVGGCLAAGEAAALRRGAARALTRLLLAGYLRLKDKLYFRYCSLVADEDPEVREPPEHCLTSAMPAETIFNNLVECVLHFNKQGEDYNLNYDARHLIYDIMLQRMSSLQKFNLQCRLSKDVLKFAANLIDEEGDLPPDVISAVMDTITLFCGPRLKLSSGSSQREGDAADIDDLHERVTTNILTHKMKRAIAEVVVPAILKLYSHLRTSGGQISTYLVRFASDLLEDYRAEIEELIDNDDDLVGRISHFQQTIGIEPSFGNTRNLVTKSTTHEPETPRAARRRGPRFARSPPRKRALRI